MYSFVWHSYWIPSILYFVYLVQYFNKMYNISLVSFVVVLQILFFYKAQQSTKPKDTLLQNGRNCLAFKGEQIVFLIFSKCALTIMVKLKKNDPNYNFWMTWNLECWKIISEGCALRMVALSSPLIKSHFLMIVFLNNVNMYIFIKYK